MCDNSANETDDKKTQALWDAYTDILQSFYVRQIKADGAEASVALSHAFLWASLIGPANEFGWSDEEAEATFKNLRCVMKAAVLVNGEDPE